MSINEQKIYGIAFNAKQRLSQNDCVDFREQIVDTMIGYNDLGIWMEVFHDDSDMVKRLTDATVVGLKKYYNVKIVIEQGVR